MHDEQLTAELHGWTPQSIGGRTVIYGNIAQDAKGRFPDNMPVRTSYIVEVRGNVVRTYSGSLYLLVGDCVSGETLSSLQERFSETAQVE